MKLNDLYPLTEATSTNVKILRELTRMILNKVPRSLERISPNEEPYSFYGSELDLSKLKEDHVDLLAFFLHFEKTKIIFNTYSTYKDYLGVYDSDKNEMEIAVDNIYRNNGFYDNFVLDKKSTNEGGIVVTIYHELRHIMQHKDYSKYFSSESARQRPYSEREIEIDAVWNSLVAAWHPEFDVSSGDRKKSPMPFVNKVMDSLSKIKSLSPKQQEHYRKKTIKFYFNPHPDKPVSNSKDERIASLISTKIKNDTMNGVNSSGSMGFDMRTVMPDYDVEKYGRFLFPVDKTRAIFKMMDGEKTENALMNNMLYLVPAFYIDDKTAKLWKSHVNNMHGYSIADVIRNLHVGLPKDFFDLSAIKNFLRKKYGVPVYGKTKK